MFSRLHVLRWRMLITRSGLTCMTHRSLSGRRLGRTTQVGGGLRLPAGAWPSPAERVRAAEDQAAPWLAQRIPLAPGASSAQWGEPGTVCVQSKCHFVASDGSSRVWLMRDARLSYPQESLPQPLPQPALGRLLPRANFKTSCCNERLFCLGRLWTAEALSTSYPPVMLLKLLFKRPHCKAEYKTVLLYLPLTCLEFHSSFCGVWAWSWTSPMRWFLGYKLETGRALEFCKCLEVPNPTCPLLPQPPHPTNPKPHTQRVRNPSS